MVGSSEDCYITVGPSPHGEGGLKLQQAQKQQQQMKSLPAWGGWIEIIKLLNDGLYKVVPPRMGRVD